MSEPILKILNLSFRVGKKVILEQITLEVPQGKTVGLIGHNGAGKTTLFQILLGFRFAHAGTVEIFSRPHLDPESRREVGYVPERPDLFSEQTLKEALLYLGGLQGLNGETILRQAPLLLSQFNLTGAFDQKLKSFSKGMLQKALLVQALLHDPKLLILDEPMSGLDPESRQELRELFRTWKSDGKSILFSSHSMEDVHELSDSVITLERGRVKEC